MDVAAKPLEGEGPERRQFATSFPHVLLLLVVVVVVVVVVSGFDKIAYPPGCETTKRRQFAASFLRTQLRPLDTFARFTCNQLQVNCVNVHRNVVDMDSLGRGVPSVDGL